MLCPGTLISSAVRDELLAAAFKINPEDIVFKRELGKGGFGKVRARDSSIYYGVSKHTSSGYKHLVDPLEDQQSSWLQLRH